MTPKEKAIQLVDKYFSAHVETAEVVESIMTIELAKYCALITVDEILKSNYKNTLNDLGYISTSKELDDYWQEVKQEIEKL